METQAAQGDRETSREGPMDTDLLPDTQPLPNEVRQVSGGSSSEGKSKGNAAWSEIRKTKTWLRPREDTRMNFQELMQEIESHGGDTSGFNAAGSAQTLDKAGLQKFLEALAEVHKKILEDMDASTPIRMLPQGWCNTSLSWTGVNFQVKDPSQKGVGRPILQDCYGHVPAGGLLALMGPSGCGKSTLLDILAQKKTTPYSGQVFANGHDAKKDRLFKRYSTYVPQEDTMHEVLTVNEIIAFNAMLKNPPLHLLKDNEKLATGDLSGRHILLSALGLVEVQNTVIGGEQSGVRGISGGQKRRVTLARGIAAGAQLLFADEPTSGLSATDAEQCIKMLRFLCKRVGLTCVVVIHQPRIEVAELFDQLILLTSGPSKFGGSIAYNGPMAGVVDYCQEVGFPVPQHANPADWLMDMVSPGYKHVLVKKGMTRIDESVQAFVSFYKQQQAAGVNEAVDEEYRNPGTPPSELVGKRYSAFKNFASPGVLEALPSMKQQSVYRSSFKVQVAIIFYTKMKLLKRDKRAFRMRIMISCLQGCIVGIAFQDIASKIELQHMQFLFMSMQLAAMSGMQVMPALVDLRTIMKKDVDEGLHSVGAWIIGNCFVDMLIMLLCSSIVVVLLFAFGGFAWSGFPVFYKWVMICLLTMDSYFNLIAAVAPSGLLSTVYAMPCMMMFILYNGFLVSKTSAPVFMRWALYVSPFYYSLTSMANAMYGKDNCMTPGCQMVIKTYGFDEGPSESTSYLVLASLNIVFRVLQVLALNKLNKAQK